jgi:flagellar protein FliS
MIQPALQAYHRVQLVSAPPRHLLQGLYARLHADLRDAGRAIAAGDAPARERAVDHALAILVLLEAALDHAAAPQLCANLAAVYRFAFTRIFTAGVERDAAPLAEAEQVLRPVSEAFRDAAPAPSPPLAPR